MTDSTGSNNANFDATRADRDLRCYTCEKPISDATWFARIKLGDHRVAFCRPRCLELFLNSPGKYDRHLD